MQPLDASDIRGAFDDLARRLADRGATARIYVADGAAMALTYEENRLTHDVDASIETGYDEAMQAALQIAHERGWPTTWLNEQATMYMPTEQDRHGAVVYEQPSLCVVAASVEHMLALKARAARRTDEADFRRLLALAEVTGSAEVFEIVSRVFPQEAIGARQARWIAAMTGDAGGMTGPAGGV